MIIIMFFKYKCFRYVWSLLRQMVGCNVGIPFVLLNTMLAKWKIITLVLIMGELCVMHYTVIIITICVFYDTCI